MCEPVWNAGAPLEPAPESGFAILEVLVALSACALVLTFYLQIVGRSAFAHQILDDRLTVATFAQSKIDGFETEDANIGVTRGQFGEIFNWTLTVQKEPAGVLPGVNLLPLRVDLDIDWVRGGRSEHTRFSSVRLISPRKLLHAQG